MAERGGQGYYLGTISGTSVDGLDIALLEIGNQVRFVDIHTAPFTSALSTNLLELGQPGGDSLERLGEADRVLGEFIGKSILSFLADTGYRVRDILAIGSHGQTVRHRPDGAHPFTWQIGDPNVIAELTGITTVADFRRRDMAAGGQGAPLVPRFHEVLFHDPTQRRAILNVGGISNLTLLGKTPGSALTGFDCGPGNALLDAWCLQHQGETYDAAGAWGAGGQVNTTLLSRLLADPYLARNPPKSTGREHYNLTWLYPLLADLALAPRDVQRTLLEFTAAAVKAAIQTWAGEHERLIVCGGGRHNTCLMGLLGAHLSIPVVPSETLGFDGDAIEAGAFAWLARQTLHGACGSAGSVTGAAGDRVLGGIYSA